METVLSIFFTARECLKFKLAAMKDYEALQKAAPTAPTIVEEDPFGIWGHEFVRTLSGEIGNEYNDRVIQQNKNPENDDDFKDLLYMISYIIPFHIQHNAEAEAIDLLMEVQRLKLLLTLSSTSVVDNDAGDNINAAEKQKKVVVVDQNNYERICLYLIKAADYMSDPDDLSVRSILFLIALVLIVELFNCLLVCIGYLLSGSA
jgi:26S proteasome regulatory subunit N1